MKRVSALIIILVFTQIASAAWVKQRVMSLSWLYDVTFADAKKGFIVGSGGTIYESADGGATWTKRKGFTDDSLKQIRFSDSQNGWILCERDIYNRGSKGSSYMLKTTDGGETWEKLEFPDGRERIAGFFFNAKDIGFAVGENGAIYEYRPERGSWQRQTTPIRYLLLGGEFSDERGAVIVGAGGNVYFSEDGGASWLSSSFQSKPAGKINSVFFQNRSIGWIAGSGGLIYQTMNGGRTWRPQTTGVSVDLNDVQFGNSAEGFAVGNDGTILSTSTAGNVWKSEPSGIKHRLERIAVNGKRAVAVGFGGTIIVSDR